MEEFVEAGGLGALGFCCRVVCGLFLKRSGRGAPRSKPICSAEQIFCSRSAFPLRSASLISPLSYHYNFKLIMN
jgi:hypothetical protein